MVSIPTARFDVESTPSDAESNSQNRDIKSSWRSSWEDTLTDREKNTLRRVREVDDIVNATIIPKLIKILEP